MTGVFIKKYSKLCVANSIIIMVSALLLTACMQMTHTQTVYVQKPVPAAIAGQPTAALPPTPPSSKPSQNDELQNLQKRWVFAKVLASHQPLFEKLDAKTTLSLRTISPANDAEPDSVLSLSGSIGCNRMSMSVSIDATHKTITKTDRPMISTLMGCGDSDAVERVFSQFMSSLQYYQLDEQGLSLQDEQGNRLLFVSQ